tara:strand:- start:15106 stop:15675 length:570 start_codon:yes stop_codon:yes gene_type:complete
MKKILFVAAMLMLGTQAQAANLALTGTASQSSTGYWDGGASASRAIDGNTDGSFWNSSVSHTDNEQGASWQVDLGSMSNIDQIDLWNRTDCCDARLADFTVSIFDAALSTIWSQVFSGAAGTHEIFNTGSVLGQIVKIQLNGTNYLQLAEVQVFGNNVSAVPVPAALFLFAPALLGFLGLRRKSVLNVA